MSRMHDGLEAGVCVGALRMASDSIELTNSEDAALRFEALMAAFESSRGESRRRLISLDGNAPLQFVGFCYRYLARQGRTAGAPGKALAELMVSHPLLVRLLAEPRELGREEALLIVRTATQVAAGLEGALLQRFLEEDIREERLPQLFRVLELTSTVDPVGRTNMQLTRLLSSKNARVRAKAVQLLVTSTGSAEAALRLLDDQDARVRANVLESLWPLAGSSSIARVFRSCVDSPVVRVATNALVGLVKAGDPEASVMLVRNLQGEDTSLARAAAWAMGFLGDQSFRAPLEEMLRSGSVDVRGGVLRALVRLKQQRALPEALPDEDGEAPVPLTEALGILKKGARAWNEWRRDSKVRLPSLQGAEMPGAILLGADFRYCSLRNANLKGARLNFSDFFGADLRGADLRDSYLECCDLRALEVDDTTDLSDARVMGSTLYGMDLRGVRMARVELDETDLGAAQLDASAQAREIA